MPNPKEEAIFDAARRIAAPDVRRRYVQQSCGDDAKLRARVEGLLRVQDEERSFLGAAVTGVRAAVAGLIGEAPGARIGPYQLLEKIGEGGFGVVFLAEQTQPVRRRVALKVLKPGMDTKQVVARFEAERQALALMDHPNIARVFDGGTTPSGRPYFVMELVPGVPITDYCDRHQLAVRQRLELFVGVCRAVQHAHQKGVIHRDLKPSNVLVAVHDGAPAVKVIDFGIAKALGQKLTDKTLVTQSAQLVGTPLYMSPEQAEMGGLDIDTRTDVYALGVLLYELLTGTTPFERERLQTAGFDEVRRIIREEEPARPSARLSTIADAAATVSANRRSDPRQLGRLFRGELDWIVMKCLEKDRNRRYQTADELALDLQRYLRDEPVRAGPPSARYRLRKFARRHWRALAAALAFVLMLVTAVVTLTVALVAANRERVALVAVNQERQEKVAALEAEGRRRRQTRAALDAMSSQVIEDWLFQQKELSPGHKQFLEQALRAYEEFAADTGQEEESRAGVAQAYERVGIIQHRLGQRKEAEAAWERSRELFAGLVADFPGVPAYRQDLARIYIDLSNLYRYTGRVPEAEAALGQGLTFRRNLAAEFPGVPGYRHDLAKTLNDLGILLTNSSRAPEAEAAYGQSVAILTQLAADFPADPGYRDSLAQTYRSLGILLDRPGRKLEAVLKDPGRSREAAAAYEQSVAILTQLAADFPNVHRYRYQLAVSRTHLGNALRDAGRYPEAEEVFRQALTTRRELVADFPAVPDYPRGLAITLNGLGILFRITGRDREAEELYGKTLAIHRQLAADFPTVPDHQNEVAGAMVNLGRLLLDRKELPAARRLLEEALPHHQAALKARPRDPIYRRAYRNNRWRLTETLLALKEHAEAAEAAGQFLQVAVEPARDAYTAACLLAGCVRLAAQDERLPDGKRQELIATYGDSALAALRQAVEMGAKEVAQMPKDPALDPLRRRADFQRLLAQLEAKGKP
jgi:eukaryotic-like serine/threonine-protein kinase